MKMLKFEVSSQKTDSVASLSKVASLIKEVNNLSCRIRLDFANNLVVVENVNESMIDTIFELVNSYYTIFSIDIDNVFEETSVSKNPAVPVETVYSEETAITVEDSRSEENSVPAALEPVIEHSPTVLEPQTEDDLIIKKVEFENEYVEDIINKLVRTAYWAMYKKNVSESHISSYIFSTIFEISTNITGKETIDFAIGDIVDCNYGSHLIGETNGKHVHAIVCHVSDNNMVYLVPITSVYRATSSNAYLNINKSTDIIFANDFFKGGFAVLDKAKYLRAERVNSVVGKTTPDFFKQLLEQLASTFDFTNQLV